MSDSKTQNFDLSVLASNLRALRQHANLSQRELAERIGVHTASVYRAERGLAIRPRILNKICKGLRVSVDEAYENPWALNARTKERPFVLHYGAESTWYSHFDHRQHVPDDNQERIQLPKERSRLASLGLVSMFQTVAKFRMPTGPGLAFEEICGVVPYGPTINYKDYVVYCVRGDIVWKVGDESFNLTAGDVFGYANGLHFTLEPARPVEIDQLPPLILRIGGNPVKTKTRRR